MPDLTNKKKIISLLDEYIEITKEGKDGAKSKFKRLDDPVAVALYVTLKKREDFFISLRSGLRKGTIKFNEEDKTFYAVENISVIKSVKSNSYVTRDGVILISQGGQAEFNPSKHKDKDNDKNKDKYQGGIRKIKKENKVEPLSPDTFKVRLDEYKNESLYKKMVKFASGMDEQQVSEAEEKELKEKKEEEEKIHRENDRIAKERAIEEKKRKAELEKKKEEKAEKAALEKEQKEAAEALETERKKGDLALQQLLPKSVDGDQEGHDFDDYEEESVLEPMSSGDKDIQAKDKEELNLSLAGAHADADDDFDDPSLFEKVEESAAEPVALAEPVAEPAELAAVPAETPAAAKQVTAEMQGQEEVAAATVAEKAEAEKKVEEKEVELQAAPAPEALEAKPEVKPEPPAVEPEAPAATAAEPAAAKVKRTPTRIYQNRPLPPIPIEEAPATEKPAPALHLPLHTAATPVIPALEAPGDKGTLDFIKEQHERLNIKIVNSQPSSNPNKVEFKSTSHPENPPITFSAELDKNVVKYKIIKKNSSSYKSSESETVTDELKAAYALLVKVAFEAHFQNPSTKDKPLILTVSEKLPQAKQEAYIEAITAEVESRLQDNPGIKIEAKIKGETEVKAEMKWPKADAQKKMKI